MILAVGSTRAPKVDAVRRALAVLARLAPELGAAEVVPVDVPTAPRMPLSLEEIREGARLRANAARAAVAGANMGVGLEGGLDVRVASAREGLLTSWAFATDGVRGAFGAGGAVPVPERLLALVVDGGVELSTAIDSLSGEHDVRSRQGAWGVLTRGLLDRTASFELALLNALAPFYHPEAYA